MNFLNAIIRKFRKAPSCQDVNRFLADYVEDNLDRGTRRQFDKHLRDCPACRTYFDQYAETIRLVQEDEVEIPSGLAEHTLEFLRSTSVWH